MVVGTRSAVFAPVADLSLLIVDEEHDSSYKQEDTPRYHARDVGVMRAKMANAVVVLGSATPSLESYFNAKKNKYALIELPDRVEQRPLPAVEIIDMRQEFQETGEDKFFSRKLVQVITQPVSPWRLHNGVFLNVPPTSLPCGTSTLKPGRIASFIRAARAGLVSISRATSICSIRLPWL